jgi:hypothetical protein
MCCPKKRLSTHDPLNFASFSLLSQNEVGDIAYKSVSSMMFRADSRNVFGKDGLSKDGLIR